MSATTPQRIYQLCVPFKSWCTKIENTPGIIKYTFWQYASQWRHAFYACINKGQAFVPVEIRDKAVGIDADIKDVVSGILDRND